MADAVQAVLARQVRPVQVADVREQVHPIALGQAVREIDHRRLQHEHVEPLRAHLFEGHRPAGKCGEALEERMPVDPAGLVIVEADALEERLQRRAIGIVDGKAFEDRPRVEMHEDPADVEHDAPDRLLQPTHLRTRPVSRCTKFGRA